MRHGHRGMGHEQSKQIRRSYLDSDPGPDRSRSRSRSRSFASFPFLPFDRLQFSHLASFHFKLLQVGPGWAASRWREQYIKGSKSSLLLAPAHPSGHVSTQVMSRFNVNYLQEKPGLRIYCYMVADLSTPGSFTLYRDEITKTVLEV